MHFVVALNVRVLFLGSTQITEQYETKKEEARRAHGEDSKECRGAALDLATSMQDFALLLKQEVTWRNKVCVRASEGHCRCRHYIV